MRASVYILKEICEEFISSLSGTVKAVAVNGSAFDLTVCNPYFLRYGSVINIGGIDYTVSSVSGNVVTVTGSGTPAVSDTFSFPNGYVFNGTPIQTAHELNRILNANEKTPMIYIKEVLKDNFTPKYSDLPYDRATDFELYFMDQANYEDWDTDQHYGDAVHPMMKFSLGLQEYLSDHKNILSVDSWEVEYHAKFSVEVTVSGHTQNLFGTLVSGVKTVCNLKIKAGEECLC